MINPARIIASCGTHVHVCEIESCGRDARAIHARPLENEFGKRSAQIKVCDLFNALPQLEIADVRIAPTSAGRVAEARRLGSDQQLLHAPGCVVPSHRLMIFGKLAIIAKARGVLEQLADRKRLSRQWLVERQPTRLYQAQNSRR